MKLNIAQILGAIGAAIGQIELVFNGRPIHFTFGHTHFDLHITVTPKGDAPSPATGG